MAAFAIMADVMGSMDAVYAKWEKKATMNGAVASGYSQHSTAQQAVESGRKAWKSKFKELPPQPERRTRNSRSSGPRAQAFKMVCNPSSMYVVLL